jgi:hypothetical protein
LQHLLYLCCPQFKARAGAAHRLKRQSGTGHPSSMEWFKAMLRIGHIRKRCLK